MTDRERDAVPPPSKDRRWDIDDRGTGRRRRARPRAEDRGAARGRRAAELGGRGTRAHIWPHLERAISALGSPWRSAQYSIDPDGRLIIELVHEPVDADRRRSALQGDVMRLLGLVIEGATYVEVGAWSSDDALAVDVVTGMLDDQTPFKGHGHTLRFRVQAGTTPS